MHTQDHPTFSTWLMRYFFRGWLTGVSFFAAALVLLNKNFTTLGWLCAIGFGVSVVWTLGHLYYRLHHIECPRCGSATHTEQDFAKRIWVAHCATCQTTWNLGVGIGHES